MCTILWKLILDLKKKGLYFLRVQICTILNIIKECILRCFCAKKKKIATIGLRNEMKEIVFSDSKFSKAH